MCERFLFGKAVPFAQESTELQNAISGHLHRFRSLEEDARNDVVRFEDGAAECRSWVGVVRFRMNVFRDFQTTMYPILSRNADAIADPSRRRGPFVQTRDFAERATPWGMMKNGLFLVFR